MFVSILLSFFKKTENNKKKINKKIKEYSENWIGSRLKSGKPLERYN